MENFFHLFVSNFSAIYFVDESKNGSIRNVNKASPLTAKPARLACQQLVASSNRLLTCDFQEIFIFWLFRTNSKLAFVKKKEQFCN